MAGMFGSFFHPEKGYEKAQNQYDKYYGQAQGFQKPYLQGGQEAYGPLHGAMNDLLHPAQMYEQMMANYHDSPYVQQQQEEQRQNMMNTLSSMGFGGSSAGLRALQAGQANLHSQGAETYLQNLMNMHGYWAEHLWHWRGCCGSTIWSGYDYG